MTRQKLKVIFQQIVACWKMSISAWQAAPACLVGLITVLFLQGLTPLGTAWVAKLLFDLLGEGIIRHQASNLVPRLVFLLLAQAGLFISIQFLSPLALYLNAELGRALSLRLKADMYQKLNSFSDLTYFENPQFHDKIQLVANSAVVSPLQFVTVLTNFLESLVTITTFLGVLLVFNPLLASLLCIVALPQCYIQLRFSRQRVDVVLNNTPKERRAAYYGRILSWITFAKEVRLFHLGDYFLELFVRLTRETNQTQREQQRRELFWKSLFSVITGIVTTGAFTLVIFQALLGHLSIGDVALYINAVSSVQMIFMGIVVAFSQMNESALFYQHYKDMLLLPQNNAKTIICQPICPLTSGISFCNVSFRYSETDAWILRHTNLFIPAKKCLALVGLNGAGKTTLVKLLTRLYEPTEGQILWDGIDIRQFDLQEFRQHLSTIFQDFARYDLSIQENIGVGDVEHIKDKDIVKQAAVKAGVHERILELPRQYEQALGRWMTHEQPGIDLSGGEWQKIALARMFMRNADLLILDEPSASLDAQAEHNLHAQFQTLMKGRTSLVITHRFNTVRMADVIAVIEQGKVTAFGNHKQLLAEKGIYASLYNMQAEQYQLTLE